MSIPKRFAVAVIVVVVALAIVMVSVDRWRGGGFQSDGPEMRLLREVLPLRPGVSVADVGAGQGDLTMALAAMVGPDGHVFSSDIDPEAVEQIRARVGSAALRNVSVLQSEVANTGLPMNCCDAVVVRRVYHHLNDPAATNSSLLRALRPGGILAVIDFPPMLSWLFRSPTGVPGNRNGHGVTSTIVVDEVTGSGFELVKLIEDWPGREPLESYCALFRKSQH